MNRLGRFLPDKRVAEEILRRSNGFGNVAVTNKTIVNTSSVGGTGDIIDDDSDSLSLVKSSWRLNDELGYHPPYQELISVPRLITTSAGLDREGNPNEEGFIDGDFITLIWDDIRTYPQIGYPIKLVYDGYTGVERTIGWQYRGAVYQITYSVFIYVCSDNIAPVLPYPGQYQGTDAVNNPYWYYIGDYKGNTATVKLPLDKYVAFWVGFKFRNYSTEIDHTPYYENEEN